MTATAAHDGETYVAFLLQSGAGKTYSSISSGGGTNFPGATKKEANDTSAHSMVFYDNVGANHHLTDLPSIDVTFTTAPAANGWCVFVAMGDNSGTLTKSNSTDMTFAGNGTNPTATCTPAGIDANDALVYALEIDNSGVPNGLPSGYTLLGSGTNGSGITYYIYYKYPAVGGSSDNFSLPLLGTSIHWALTGMAFANPGTGKDPYILDQGVAAITSTTHLAFTADNHGSFAVNYPQACSATATGTASCVKGVGHIVPVATTTCTASIRKGTTKSFAATAVGTALLTRGAGFVALLTAVAVGTASLVRRTGKPLAATTTGTSSVQKGIAKFMRDDNPIPQAQDGETYFAVMVSNDAVGIYAAADGDGGMTAAVNSNGQLAETGSGVNSTSMVASEYTDTNEAGHLASDIPGFAVGWAFFQAHPDDAESYAWMIALGTAASAGTETSSLYGYNRNISGSAGTVNSSNNFSGPSAGMLMTYCIIVGNSATITDDSLLTAAGWTRQITSTGLHGFTLYFYTKIATGSEGGSYAYPAATLSATTKWSTHFAYIATPSDPTGHAYVIDKGQPIDDPTPAGLTNGLRFTSTEHGVDASDFTIPTAQGIASMTKNVGKRLSAVTTGTAFFARVLGKVMSATATGTASVRKSVSKNLTASTTGTASVTKNIPMLLTAVAVGTASLFAGAAGAINRVYIVTSMRVASTFKATLRAAKTLITKL